jgi:hypothetical protein
MDHSDTRRRSRNTYERGSLSSSQSPLASNFVTLNAGGTHLTTTRAALLAEPHSVLARAVATDFHDIPKDELGHPFFSCDANNLEVILDYLRGYSVDVDASEIALLQQEANVLGLSSLARSIGGDPDQQHRFPRSTGISDSGTRMTFGSVTQLARLQDGSHLQPGHHIFTFLLDKMEPQSFVVTGLFHLCDVAQFPDLYTRTFTGYPFSVAYSSAGTIYVNPTLEVGKQQREVAIGGEQLPRLPWDAPRPLAAGTFVTYDVDVAPDGRSANIVTSTSSVQTAKIPVHAIKFNHHDELKLVAAVHIRGTASVTIASYEFVAPGHDQ